MNEKEKSVKKFGGGQQRNSNLELFRIITMFCIVAHHYVVNSGLSQLVQERNSLDFKSIFILLFGWGGKTGINCFVLITGYFMCKSHITVKKFLKLICERYFYAILFFVLFLLTGYAKFSKIEFLKMIFPFFTVQTNFMTCYLLFYLFIPFINKLIKAMSEKEHLMLIGLFLLVYTILPSFALSSVSFNYITWFSILYLIAAYLRIYEKLWFKSTKLWGLMTLVSLILSWLSVIVLTYLGIRFEHPGYSYFFVNDSNKILALTTSICAFLFFKNVKIPQNYWINTIAASTLGVLLIHANSDTMRQWLWHDILKNVSYFDSPFLVLHAVGSVVGIYLVCTLIDQIRIRLIEKPLFRRVEK